MPEPGSPNSGRDRAPSTSSRWRPIGAALVVAALLSACGYRLSGQSVALPEGVEAIGIPTFINRTTRPDLEQRITEQVTAQFSTRGRIRIVADEEGADAVLLGTILTYITNPVVINEQGRASRYEIRITASVVLREAKTDRLLWQDDHYLFRGQYDVPATTEAFVDQEIVAIDEVARDFARSVVTAILEGF